MKKLLLLILLLPATLKADTENKQPEGTISNLHIMDADQYYDAVIQEKMRRKEDYSSGYYSPSRYEEELQAAKVGLLK